jgi:hypothetical protein
MPGTYNLAGTDAHLDMWCLGLAWKERDQVGSVLCHQQMRGWLRETSPSYAAGFMAAYFNGSMLLVLNLDHHHALDRSFQGAMDESIPGAGTRSRRRRWFRRLIRS